mmetsp:Transcript_61511/g.181785  ORF Transcript_61511/g.181785 Transcript_61511/m.181785 type:complete len:105 (-) Transcript_61511:274-588(-)
MRMQSTFRSAPGGKKEEEEGEESFSIDIGGGLDSFLRCERFGEAHATPCHRSIVVVPSTLVVPPHPTLGQYIYRIIPRIPGIGYIYGARTYVTFPPMIPPRGIV